MSEVRYANDDDDQDVDQIDQDFEDDENENNVQDLVGWDYSDDGPISDDPVAEGDDPVAPKPEPSYSKASETKFFSICKGLEIVCKNNRKRDRHFSEVDKLKTILKPEYLSWLAEPKGVGEPPESLFPVLRLLLPDKDGSRSFQMKEKTLAKMYTDAFGFNPGTSKYNKLLHFNNPNIVSPDEGVGDFALVVHSVIRTVKVQTTKSKGLSVGEVNKFLDELASLPRKAREAKSNHDWRRTANPDQNKNSNVAVKKPPNLNNLRADWLKRINMDTPSRLGLSPLEHKWLVRIVLNKLHIGVGWKTLLKWYNPYAAMLWSAHNSLKGICDKLCDPNFSQSRDVLRLEQKSEIGDSNNEMIGLDSYMPKSLAVPQFGNPFSPMLSDRTGFERVLDDISRRHRAFMKSEGAVRFPKLVNSLSFNHPSFSVEPKLDGERLLVHVGRDGVVRMHTRRGNWYSDLYSPVLGPAIRKAVEAWGFDIILDGEVLAWDSGRQETVPFGNNRTIARLRQKWMQVNGLLDSRDQDIHVGETNVKSMNASNTWNDGKNQPYDLAGKECWLQFIVFDVVYIDGPQADVFLRQTVSPTCNPMPSPGSIINLDCFERKKVLYKLISPQEQQVEIVKTWIIRPNGKISSGEDYFDPQHPDIECGFAQHTLDSLRCILSDNSEDLDRIDGERRKGLSDEQISQARANALQKIYDNIVENQRMEGLVFKDLSAPYYIGDESKSMRYWHKFKPDYFNGSVASDLDVVIIGAYFATGLRFSGKPSSFLCACVDSEDEERFLTLCKVSMGSTDTATANSFLDSTGFSTEASHPDRTSERNAWFRAADHGKTLPDFLSKRSYQSKSTNGSWRFEKKDYPDLWIHPADSRILTLNAGEIVISDTFSAGVTLRFPRINKIREGADDKPRSDIESDLSLWKIFQDVTESRSGVDSGESIKLGSSVKHDIHKECRFMTEEQLQLLKGKTKRSISSKRAPGVVIPTMTKRESYVLKGLTFHVFEGSYGLSYNSSAMHEAMEQGWIREGRRVSSSSDVQTFLVNHGGRHILTPDGEDTIVVGGSRGDPKVLAFIRSIETAYVKQSSRLKSKKIEQGALATLKQGCLRWMYVYSLVHRWLDKTKRSELPIKDSDPDFLRPSVLDYLARPEKTGEKVDGIDLQLLTADLTSVSDIRRAIEIVSEATSCSKSEKINRSDAKSWQKEAVERLTKDERWAVACKHQVLWPYSEDHEPDGLVLIYPHIFRDFGNIESSDSSTEHVERWKSALPLAQANAIESVIPLARVMGAIVTPHLHRLVTHVLCDLRGVDVLKYDGDVTNEVFVARQRGSDLLKRLEEIRKHTSHEIHLISATWLRKRKWQS